MFANGHRMACDTRFEKRANKTIFVFLAWLQYKAMFGNNAFHQPSKNFLSDFFVGMKILDAWIFDRTNNRMPKWSFGIIFIHTIFESLLLAYILSTLKCVFLIVVLDNKIEWNNLRSFHFGGNK